MTTMDRGTMIRQEAEHARAAWDRIADGYDEHVTPTGDWALPRRALELVGLRAGMRFLDVASGSGALGIPAARIGARVLAVDISPCMIERLDARAREEGLSNLQGRVMDGHELQLEDEEFDVAGSQFGVMLLPDLPRALKEMVRVTRPGGQVLMVVYGSPANVEFLSFFMRAMQAEVPGFTGLPSHPPPLPFQVSDPEVLRMRMAEAGLTGIRIEPGDERLEFRSAGEMWDWVVNSNPIPAALVAELSEEHQASVRRALDAMLRERGRGGTAVLSGEVHIGIGRK